ncbi:MAG: isoamylase early set domain-containing protein [Halothiobacillaceae bacterium]
MSFTKKYFKTRPVCKVTFTLPPQHHESVDKVSLVGDFNGWDANAMPMKRRKDGSWRIKVKLESGREYQFLYQLGEKQYVNDDAADAYVPNPYGTGENSVIRV